MRCVIECELRRLRCPDCGVHLEACRGWEAALTTRATSRTSRRGSRGRWAKTPVAGLLRIS